MFYHNPVSQVGTYSRNAGQLQVFVQAYHTYSSGRQQRFNGYHTRFYHTPKHTLWVVGRAIHPLFITPPHLSHPQTHLVGVRTSYHTPWFITPPLGPLRAAMYHPGYTRYHTPHRIPHPVITFWDLKILTPGCVILCQLRYLTNLRKHSAFEIPVPSPDADAASPPGNELPSSTEPFALVGHWGPKLAPEPTATVAGSRAGLEEAWGIQNSSSLSSSTAGTHGFGRWGEIIGVTAKGKKSSSMRVVVGHGSHSKAGCPTNTLRRRWRAFRAGLSNIGSCILFLAFFIWGYFDLVFSSCGACGTVAVGRAAGLAGHKGPCVAL